MDENWYTKWRSTLSYPWDTFPLARNLSPIHYLYNELQKENGEKYFHVVGFMQYGNDGDVCPFVILEWYSNLTQCWTLYTEHGKPTVVIRNYDDIHAHRAMRYSVAQARATWKSLAACGYLPVGKEDDPAAKITFEKAAKEMSFSIWKDRLLLKEVEGEDDIYGSGSPAEFMAKLEDRKRSKYGKNYKEKIRERENWG